MLKDWVQRLIENIICNKSTTDIGDLTSGASGEYAVELRSGLEYGLVAARRGYTGRKEIVNIPADNESAEITQDLYLVPDLPKMIVTVLFYFDKADLIESYRSQPEELLSYFAPEPLMFFR